jgi:hemoglobin
MRTLLISLLVCAACGGSVAPAASTPPAPTPVAAEGALYHRLGGYDAIAAVVDDFLGRWLADSTLAPFFAHLEENGLHYVRQMVVDQLCAAAGGPCFYVGLDMATAHAEMEITPAVWNVAVQHLLATFDAFGIPTRERRELDGILRAVRAEMVTGSGER